LPGFYRRSENLFVIGKAAMTVALASAIDFIISDDAPEGTL